MKTHKLGAGHKLACSQCTGINCIAINWPAPNVWVFMATRKPKYNDTIGLKRINDGAAHFLEVTLKQQPKNKIKVKMSS